MTPQPTRPVPLSLDALESRELPAAGAWLTEAFQRSASAGLPGGWSEWAGGPAADFRVDPSGPGLGDRGRLVSAAGSAAAGRAWLTAPYAADVETSAAVYLNTAAAVHLYVRGQNLHTARPSYYAVSVVRGAEVQLVKVVNGQATVLGSVKSAEYVSGKWVTVSVAAEGTRLRVTFHRGDTNQYLGADGKWTRQPTAAVAATDAAVRGGGQVGFARPAGVAGEVAIDSLRVGPAADAGRPVVAEERFARGTGAGLPPGWSQWVGGGQAAFATTADQTLRVTAASSATARAWSNQLASANVQVSSSVYVDSLVPAGVFARGSNADTSRPTYYALTVRRGLEATLWRVVGGAATPLGTVKSKEWLSGLWVQASLVATGGQLRVQLYRSDTGQYLGADGSWGLSPSWAMTRADAAIRNGSRVGLTREAGYAGQLVFDNVIVTAAPASGSAPTPIPTEGDKPTSPPPPPEDRPTPTPPPTVPPPPTAPPPPTVPPPAIPSNPSLPAVPRHYAWIRLANLAYYGTPLGSVEQNLLRNSIDLVIPNQEYLDDVARVSPTTPQFVYTNVSNMYLGLLTDWTEYADRHGHDREAAFYHATRATRLTGSSASAVPVNQFWGVYRETATGWQNLTRDARASGTSLRFADTGRSMAFGFVEKFREVNVTLRAPAANGWSARLEYVAAVDAQGRPTAWKPLTTLSDTTGLLRRSGTLTFDPPRDWVPASVGGSARLYYVRFRTAAGGTAPDAATVLGRDYTKGGMIPAFDHTADRDRDGYLSDAEYARRRPGMDARFEYESRITYPNYGPMRFATNVSNPAFRAWAADYHARVAGTLPLARGFFVDNSIGRLAVDPSAVAERMDGYSEDYGSLLGAINRRLAPSGKWLIANTAGGGTSAEPVARAGVSYLEEFSLRPMTANHVQFDDLAATLRYRRQLSGGKAYEILDSLPQGRDANDPRTQLATLAMYYAVADQNLSMLMVNGGNEPASGWNRHWIPAVKFNVGKPRAAAATVFATGTDPANRALTYKVYGRRYDNALVLYKPLSYTRGATGTTADNTATTHRLDGWYRPVRADGTLGAAVNSVTLRNGEGAVLARA